MTLLPVILIFAGFLLQEPSIDSKPVTVCQVLHQPAEFDGKMVRLRARELVGPETDILRDPACTKWLKLDGEKYPPFLWIAKPDEGRRLKYPATFELDREAMERTYGRIRGIPYEQRPWLIVTGRIESFPFFRWQRRTPSGAPVGKYRSFGFGHVNAAPAQIVIQSVEIEAGTTEK